MSTPPFADLSAFATAMGELVSDAHGSRSDSDLVEDALETFSQLEPSWHTADIGDGATFEWELGKAAEPFVDFQLGYSEKWIVRVEQLDATGLPQRPPVFLDEDAVCWYDQRVGPLLFLVFRDVPSATAKLRIRWRRKWVIVGTTNIPKAQHMAVVYLAAEAKCNALASWYRRTSDAGSDLFDGISAAEGYERAATRWGKRARSGLGITPSPVIRTTQIRTGRTRVFRKNIP